MPVARGLSAWLLILFLAQAAAGCASRSGGPASPPVAPPPAYEPEGPDDFIGPQNESPPRAPEARGSSAPRPRPTPTPPPEEEAAAPDTLPAPTISVELTEEERARLHQETEADLGQARATLSRVGLEGLSAAEREAGETLRDLIDSAMRARERDDLRAAAQLARKARLLAEELAKGH